MGEGKAPKYVGVGRERVSLELRDELLECTPWKGHGNGADPEDAKALYDWLIFEITLALNGQVWFADSFANASHIFGEHMWSVSLYCAFWPARDL